MGKKNKHDHKFTLGQFTWNGFNLTVGITFLGSLAYFANSQHETDGPQGVGLGFNIIWIFMIMGLIAGICAFAFTRLSRVHKQDNNGGAYIFARSMFGRFVGFITLFLNYIIMPLVLANQILMFVKANLDPNMATGQANSDFWLVGWTKHLGNWSFLSFDLIGVALSIVFILMAFFSTKIYKKASRYILIIKWVASGFLVFFGIVAACLPMNSGNAAKWANTTTESGGLTLNHFLMAFCACFYYFTGFEAFASSGATVREPEKNVGRGVMLVMIFSVTFYILIVILFMFAQNSFVQNVSTGFWISLDQSHYPWLHWLLYVGPLVMFIFTIASRGNTCSQIALYGGTTLQPMSQEGYISNNFGKQNKSGFPIGAMKLNIIIVAITVGFWAIIPDIIIGFAGPKANFINVNTIISAASIFYMVIYIIILLAILKFVFCGLIKIPRIEIVLYVVALITLSLVFVYHFYDLFEKAFHSKQISDIVGCIVEIAFILSCIVFIVCVYFIYYQKKYSQRLKTNPEIQKKLNYEFRILDGWMYFKGVFCLTSNKFFNKRSKLVNQNYEDLSNDLFKHKYKKQSEKFLRKIKKSVSKYVICSQKIEQYNLGHDINNKKEISNAKRDARQFETFIENSVQKPPRDYIWLSYLKGVHYNGIYLPPSVYERIRELESILQRE